MGDDKTDLTPLQIEVRGELEKFEAWQLHIQGQVNALRVALAACLSFPQVNAGLQSHVQTHVLAGLAAMKEGASTQAAVAGYEGVLRELLGGNQQGAETSR